MFVGLLEPLILSQGLASKKIISYDSGSIATTKSTELKINPDNDDIWIINKIVFGNINSAVWTGSIKHPLFDSTVTTTLEASFLSEVIDTWIEVTKGNILLFGFKNTNIIAESFDVTVHVLVIKGVTNLVTVRRLVRGVGNFFSLLGSLSFNSDYHDALIKKVLAKLDTSPAGSPTVQAEPRTIIQPKKSAPDDYRDKIPMDAKKIRVR